MQLNEAIESGKRNICLTSPTGGGKSRMCMTRVVEQDRARRKSIIYTHRTMLFNQWYSVLNEFGLDVGKRASGHETALLKRNQLAMIQSEHSAVTRGAREVHRADEIWIDEAHCNKQSQTEELIAKHREANPDCVVIGLTATPMGVAHLYDHLIVAGKNSELRECGSHIPAYHFGPDEPDLKLIGRESESEVTSGGETGIANQKRQKYIETFFGSIVQNYETLNPERKPTLCFAPGVEQSVWLARMLTNQGIQAAHIDGMKCWVEGDTIVKDQDAVDQILADCESGRIKVVTNRFVMREGIDATFFGHCIFATVFGSMTSYVQSGGRVIRNHPGLDCVTIQDHGGNWWRFGSLNEDRQWSLDINDRVACSMRLDDVREGKAKEPLQCPQCNKIRSGAGACPGCGHVFAHSQRMVRFSNGDLKPMANKTLQPRRVLQDSESVRQEWRSRVLACRNSRKATVRSMTFAQLATNFARDNYWRYAPRDIPFTPKRDVDWFLPISSVPLEGLKD